MRHIEEAIDKEFERDERTATQEAGCTDDPADPGPDCPADRDLLSPEDVPGERVIKNVEHMTIIIGKE